MKQFGDVDVYGGYRNKPKGYSDIFPITGAFSETKSMILILTNVPKESNTILSISELMDLLKYSRKQFGDVEVYAGDFHDTDSFELLPVTGIDMYKSPTNQTFIKLTNARKE